VSHILTQVVNACSNLWLFRVSYFIGFVAKETNQLKPLRTTVYFTNGPRRELPACYSKLHEESEVKVFGTNTRI